MNDSAMSFRRSIMPLMTGVLAGAAATLVVLRATGMIIPANLANRTFHKFVTTYEALYTEYYRPVPSATLLNGAVAGMTNSLNDPFTDYFPPAGETQLQNMLSNAYVGIGVVVAETNGRLAVQSVIAKSPAAEVGLKPGDVIVAVNGKSIAGMSETEATSLIQGKSGTTLRLEVDRASEKGRLLEFTLTRERITAPEVYTRMLRDHVGYLRLSIVGSNAAEEVKKAFLGLKKDGATRLILDLRGNPGGYLDQALQIANTLIPKGKVVVKVEARTGAPQIFTSKGPGTRMPIVVLMDRGTASAAEILSAALHDDEGTPLLGTRSYGKGTAQTSVVYSDGSGMKFTYAKWLTPTGKWINHIGLHPTNPVNLPSYASLPSLSGASLPLRLNQVSSDVKTLQETLRALGYPVDRVDGYFDASTEQNVRKFQTEHKLPATGVVDEKTADAIESALQGLIASHDTQLNAALRLVLKLPLR